MRFRFIALGLSYLVMTGVGIAARAQTLHHRTHTHRAASHRRHHSPAVFRHRTGDITIPQVRRRPVDHRRHRWMRAVWSQPLLFRFALPAGARISSGPANCAAFDRPVTPF